MKHNVKKVIILGSGGIKIGQAGEFDYSGSQAARAMTEEGISTVLINPNIATYQTSEQMADKIYFVPVTPYFVEKIIKKEKPDGILLAFGGQTALNCGVELEKADIFKKYKVKVLGTPVHAINETEDRQLFKDKLEEIGCKSPLSIATANVAEAIKAADNIGYPVMARVAFALGGLGSGICRNKQELIKRCSSAFTSTPQVLIEEWLGGWKEVEYEVVRDSYDNCITVCNMENFDPLGVHTGESIVVAPSQTLSNSEYHKLREIATRVIRHIGIVGECNIQYALDPVSEDYRIIEVNARLSRSSALASKATGYPLAFIAAKLGLGYSLTEIENKITKKTMACFEPALDYIVVKIPRWDLNKFRRAEFTIGSEMKSVGEIMSIGRNFEEAIQKAIRMLGVDMNGLVCNDMGFKKDLSYDIATPTDKRIFAIAEGLKKSFSVDKIYDMNKIDKWFLYKLKNIVDLERKIKHQKLDKELMLDAKQLGFSDKQLGVLKKTDELDIRKQRKKFNITPKVKQIDTLAAEFPAKTNYLYLTYNATEDDITFKEKKAVVVLGGGAYRIGSSVEFDWCCVNSVITLNNLGFKTIMINYNPETVSTDYDICDRLYFDDLSFETVLDIHDKESPQGVIVSMGGQIPNNLALPLSKQGVNILGTPPSSIDNAEDRYKFSKLLDKIKVDQPDWKELTSIKEAEKFAKRVGYPVLIRPSYVLSGAAMSVAYDEKELGNYLNRASEVSKEHPVVLTKFLTNAKEIEIDAVAKDGEILIYAISEHIENAGVHSGDATMALPPQNLYLQTTRRIKKAAREIAKNLKITGPFNIQFLAKNNDIKVIECNLRASRSFPFCSKVFKHNFIDIATRAMLNQKLPKIDKSSLDLDYVGVKAPQFSFSRIKGADPILSVEMASTGEVACLGEDLNDAFLKAYLSTNFIHPKKNILVSVGGEHNRYDLLESVRKLKEAGYNLYATETTSKFLAKHGIPNSMLFKLHEHELRKLSFKRMVDEFSKFKFKKFFTRQMNRIRKVTDKNVFNYIIKKKIDMVISIPNEHKSIDYDDHSILRRLSIDFTIPLITNVQIAKRTISSMLQYTIDDLEVKSWDEYN